MKTITIGIPAYNEEINIQNILTSLLNQKDISIKRIFIASDASTDKTNKIVNSMAKNNSVIKLLNGIHRIGKAKRINQIFKNSDTDFVVILDADITIESETTIFNLVKPMLKDNSIMLTSGNSKPKVPKNFAQRTAFAGFLFWNKAREITKNSDLYYCEGPIRAFNRELYKEMIFPASIAEDVYPYLYCMSRGYKFKKTEKAKIFYTLPATIKDYSKQMARAISTHKVQECNFEKSFLNKYYTIGFKEKIVSMIGNLARDPFWTLSFLILIGIPKLKDIFISSADTGVWNIVQSTK